MSNFSINQLHFRADSYPFPCFQRLPEIPKFPLSSCCRLGLVFVTSFVAYSSTDFAPSLRCRLAPAQPSAATLFSLARIFSVQASLSLPIFFVAAQRLAIVVEYATKALEATNGTTLEKNGQILRVAYAKSILGPGSGTSGPSHSSSLAAATIEAVTFSQQYDAGGWASKEYNLDDKKSTSAQVKIWWGASGSK